MDEAVSNVSASSHASLINVTEASALEPIETVENLVVNEKDDPHVILSNVRKKNLNRVILGHLNINHLSGKIEDLRWTKMDVLVLTETKIDDLYPTSHFFIEGFSPPFRLDRNANGGGVMIYVFYLIPCNQVEFLSRPNDVEGIFLELNLRNAKWFLMGGYNRSKHTISYFLNHISNNLDNRMGNYDNFILLLLSYFNSMMIESQMLDFCLFCNLSNLIKEPTCYKNPLNPTSIDVILTNRVNSFQNSIGIETGLSDHHKMVATVLKVYVKKLEPITVKYRCYKNFCMNDFTENLKQKFEKFGQIMSCT